MKRAIPVEPNAELDLYVRTVYSLLRSSGEVDVRAFEEAHAYSHSSLHEGALSPMPDLSAFAYAAARLPACIFKVKRLVLAQSHELFEAAGFDVRNWQIVRTRGRRRPLRWDGKDTLAVFIASASDIDDLVPIVTAFQIEWNKMHARLHGLGPSQGDKSGRVTLPSTRVLARLLDLDTEAMGKLVSAFGGKANFADGLAAIASHPLKLRLRMLAPSHSQYQRAAQRWWSGVEPTYLREEEPRRPGTYFVSSNTHAIANLMGGFAMTERKTILAWAKRNNPEGLGDAIVEAEKTKDETALLPFVHYLLRSWIHDGEGDERRERVRAFEAEGGLFHLAEPGNIDVDAQIIELRRLIPERLDPRLQMPGLELLKHSDAVLLNIDYPLGMAAYHLLSRVGQAVGDMRGVYVMGKAATLNGRVGDVMLSNAVYDEHSQNTFLVNNAFHTADIGPYLQHGSVFDGQRAVTVRSAFLQNKDYMASLYRQGYSVLEMEAGPFAAAVYELSNPTRVPQGEIVSLGELPFELGIVHYASDTPYSRRQSLLSKSLSFFGVDATYACAIAIVRRILETEINRLRKLHSDEEVLADAAARKVEPMQRRLTTQPVGPRASGAETQKISVSPATTPTKAPAKKPASPARTTGLRTPQAAKPGKRKG